MLAEEYSIFGAPKVNLTCVDNVLGGIRQHKVIMLDWQFPFKQQDVQQIVIMF